MPRTRGATVFGAGHCWAPAHFWLCLFEGQVCELCSGLLAKALSCPCALIYPAPTRTHPEPPEGLPTSCPPARSTGRSCTACAAFSTSGQRGHAPTSVLQKLRNCPKFGNNNRHTPDTAATPMQNYLDPFFFFFSKAEQEGTVAARLQAQGSALFQAQQKQHPSASPA